MRIENKWRTLCCSNEYVCAITDELNHLSGYDNVQYGHYVLFNKEYIKDKNTPIRVIGGTVGAIRIDDSLIITDIIIDTDYVVKTYPVNVNELMKHWIGEKIGMEENG